ncbi:YbaB/EbfC family nucleoid-associated protein [Goodfellowiella coeruleoviolacea]|nr:YbaB/EbfC family nucleoid-associated protein [Goodfellowiella coeruleoviolacea]
MDEIVDARRINAEVAANQQRLRAAVARPGALGARATSGDGTVVVEAGPGGALRSVTLSPEALRQGGQRLAQTVLAVANQASAKANQRTQYAMRAAVGADAAGELDRLGLGFDPRLAEDEDAETARRGW